MVRLFPRGCRCGSARCGDVWRRRQQAAAAWLVAYTRFRLGLWLWKGGEEALGASERGSAPRGPWPDGELQDSAAELLATAQSLLAAEEWAEPADRAQRAWSGTRPPLLWLLCSETSAWLLAALEASSWSRPAAFISPCQRQLSDGGSGTAICSPPLLPTAALHMQGALTLKRATNRKLQQAVKAGDATEMAPHAAAPAKQKPAVQKPQALRTRVQCDGAMLKGGNVAKDGVRLLATICGGRETEKRSEGCSWLLRLVPPGRRSAGCLPRTAGGAGVRGRSAGSSTDLPSPPTAARKEGGQREGRGGAVSRLHRLSKEERAHVIRPAAPGHQAACMPTAGIPAACTSAAC